MNVYRFNQGALKHELRASTARALGIAALMVPLLPATASAENNPPKATTGEPVTKVCDLGEVETRHFGNDDRLYRIVERCRDFIGGRLVRRTTQIDKTLVAERGDTVHTESWRITKVSNYRKGKLVFQSSSLRELDRPIVPILGTPPKPPTVQH